MKKKKELKFEWKLSRLLTQSVQVNSEAPTTYVHYDDSSVKSITKSGDQILYYYTLNGQKSQVLYPNNSRADFSHDNQGRLTSIVNRRPDASVLSSYTYGYDMLLLLLNLK